MQIKKYSAPNELAEAFCELLLEDVKRSQDASLPYRLALSGGSTPLLVFEILASRYKNRMPWETIHFFWGDERCVLPDHPDSNYGAAHRLLFSKISILPSQIHRINGEAEPAAEASRYGVLLSSNLPDKTGFPFFNLIMLGMGEDGHTASIFPNRMELLHHQAPCATVQHPVSRQTRITLTGSSILSAGKQVFLVSGRSKNAMMRTITGTREAAREYPAGYIGLHETACWLCDADALRGIPV